MCVRNLFCGGGGGRGKACQRCVLGHGLLHQESLKVDIKQSHHNVVYESLKSVQMEGELTTNGSRVKTVFVH